jgi:hypothetical protein
MRHQFLLSVDNSNAVLLFDDDCFEVVGGNGNRAGAFITVISPDQ